MSPWEGGEGREELLKVGCMNVNRTVKEIKGGKFEGMFKRGNLDVLSIGETQLKWYGVVGCERLVEYIMCYLMKMCFLEIYI